ncbi:hypothetical protein [Algoriphagus sp. CAU 1675]|uniref:hypothetical protein n=1 Tax=Algoriphagus sp. CAU 1675 TaxID=3032597 RepID=UPI0023D9ED7A|nr:hypothetical protein [Algoriphagus sp. CAU 1675]MDF2158826.1 hypothetical protein [Algoriphagus sp. CAU 1675]
MDLPEISKKYPFVQLKAAYPHLSNTNPIQAAFGLSEKLTPHFSSIFNKIWMNSIPGIFLFERITKPNFL